MKKLTVSLLFILITINITLAQEKVFFESTIIEEETGDAVEGAKITIEENSLNTVTDEKGHFSFNEILAEGSYVVSIKKEGYEPKVFLLEQKAGFKIKLKETIALVITKKEAKRRKEAAKDKEKLAKERMKDIEKERERKEKELKKQKKLLTKENTVQVEYLDTTVKKEEPVEEVEVVTENQIKYSKILEVDVTELTNKELYNFIDKWIGTPYLMGGETSKAIDCSSFSQRLYISSYDKMYLERTAQKQHNSEFTELFENKAYLSEGDLIFFGKDEFNITHVGVYLHNNKFVHSTSATFDGPSGVKISNLSDPYWSKKFLIAGRRIVNN